MIKSFGPLLWSWYARRRILFGPNMGPKIVPCHCAGGRRSLQRIAGEGKEERALVAPLFLDFDDCGALRCPAVMRLTCERLPQEMFLATTSPVALHGVQAGSLVWSKWHARPAPKQYPPQAITRCVSANPGIACHDIARKQGWPLSVLGFSQHVSTDPCPPLCAQVFRRFCPVHIRWMDEFLHHPRFSRCLPRKQNPAPPF